MTPERESELIGRVRGGDTNAFEDLVLENQKNVYNLAYKMTGNEEDALDISQEAFLKAYRQLEGFRGESRFSVWLYRLTYNLCIDFLRKKPRSNVVSLSFQGEDDETHDIEIPDVRNLPEDNVMRLELRESIAEGISGLSPQHKEILVMREITGMSYIEIAETLNISDGTVKSRLARARLSLADFLVRKGTLPDGYRQNQHKGKEVE